MNFLISALIFVASAVSTFFGAPHIPAVVEPVADIVTEQLGSQVPLAPANFETSLAIPLSSSGDSMTLTSNVIRGGSTFAGYSCFSIDEGSAQAEYVCGSIAGTAVTGMVRGIDPLTGTTTVTALKFAHRRGASVKVNDAPVVTLMARILRGEDTVTFTPDANGDLVTKEYVDALSFGGTVPVASLTDDGVAELSTGLQAASSTATDQSGSPLMLYSGISTSSAPVSGHVIPVTGSNGNIANGFIDETYWSKVASTTQVFEYSATTTWVKPAQGTMTLIELWGGGGSGGSDSTQGAGTTGAGGGGGSGEFRSMIIPLAYLPSSVVCGVGSGGTAVTTNASGVAGGTTSFGTFITAGGGTGGGQTNSDATSVNGGTAGTGGTTTSYFLSLYSSNGVAGSGASTVGAGSVTAVGNATTTSGGGGGAYTDGANHNFATGGTSLYATAGGSGASSATASVVASSGASKGAGGGGAATQVGTATSGAGANGMCRITVY